MTNAVQIVMADSLDMQKRDNRYVEQKMERGRPLRRLMDEIKENMRRML